MKLYSTGSTGTIGKHLPKGVTALKLNLASDHLVFEKIEIAPNSNLIHLAGIVGPSSVLKDVEFARAVNVRGTKFLAEAFLANSEGIFYYISTSHVYAKSDKLLTETSPIEPLNIYAEQKLEAEEVLRSVFRFHQNRLCIIRLFSVLDWDVAPFTLGGAIKKLIEPGSDFVLSNASDIRDFLTPRAIANALFEIASQKKISGIVNLCSNRGTSVGVAARKMLTESGFEVPTNRILLNESSNPVVIGDNSRLISFHPSMKLTWEPSRFNQNL